MITTLYTFPIALLFIVLSARVITYRRANRLGLGDHGDKSLAKRMRAQANCAEYAPFGLFMLMLVEMHGTSMWLLHLIGASLLLGRLIHGIGFSASPPIMKMRTWGMILTLTSYLVSIGTLAVVSLTGLMFAAL